MTDRETARPFSSLRSPFAPPKLTCGSHFKATPARMTRLPLRAYDTNQEDARRAPAEARSGYGSSSLSGQSMGNEGSGGGCTLMRRQEPGNPHKELYGLMRF